MNFDDARLVENRAESNDENAEFSVLLKQWLERKGVDLRMLRGCVIMPLLGDGFDIMYVGPSAPDAAQLLEWVGAIADTSRRLLEDDSR